MTVFVLFTWIPAQSLAAQIVWQENFESGLTGEWKTVTFDAPQTSYIVGKEGTNGFLRAHSTKSASGIARELKIPLTPGTTLEWRWKIDKIPQGGSDAKIQTFDHTARLYVAFKSFMGLPRIINYVWANEEKAGVIFNHPRSDRSRFIVLRSGNAGAGGWLAEKRDVFADWQKLFGDKTPPPISAIGVMTDSDGTETVVTGCYDELRLTKP